MPEDRLPVHISRQELHGLEVPDSLEVDGSFDVALVNHGTSLHVHLHLDDDLSEVATIDAANHFVDGESERAVRVRVDGDAPVRGRLKVVSAHGAQTRYVDVTVVESEEEEESVEVDESLAQPRSQPATEEPSALVRVAENPELLVLGLGVVALAVAAVASLVMDNVFVLAGALAVLVGVLVAMYFLVAGS
ncbi:MAG: hypothetical protein ABEJ40_02180 [Haloarculaceae archaeon]